MLFRECVRTAKNHLLTHWSRSCLAMLGIVIGTMSTVSLVYSVELFKKETFKQYTQLGIQVMLVHLQERTHTHTCQNIAHHIEYFESIKEVKRAEPIVDTQIKHVGQQSYTTAIGIRPSFAKFLNYQVNEGRLISPLDTGKPHAWIGHKLNQQYQKNTYFSDLFRFYEMPLTPTGYLAYKPSPMFIPHDINNSLLMPLTYLCQHAENIYSINYILEVNEPKDIDVISQTIKRHYQQDRSIKNVLITSPSQLIHSMNEQMKLTRYLALIIGGISLLVGGIGIMNIMLANILERRREIAIRLCFGAKRSDIIKMFLVESSLLCFVSGALGALIAIALTYFVSVQAGWEWHWIGLPLIIGLTLALSTGLAFGIYPAYQACQQTPARILKEG